MLATTSNPYSPQDVWCIFILWDDVGTTSNPYSPQDDGVYLFCGMMLAPPVTPIAPKMMVYIYSVG